MSLDVSAAIEARRAYRSLSPVEITDDDIFELASAASLAPSCFNNQPWRFILVRSPEMLARMHDALSRGNEWARNGSSILVVMSRKDLDCVIKEREYHMFDTGMAVGQLLLRATEKGLVAHPIAGFSPAKAREILGIPEDMEVITLIILGKKSEGRAPNLKDEQWEAESSRPVRKGIAEILHLDRYGGGFDG